jgi:hypothetical protein
VDEHDRELVERMRRHPTSAVVEADQPEAVAGALIGSGARALPPAVVPVWLGEAELLRDRAEAVLAAERVVAGAVAHERARRAQLLACPSAAEDGPAPTPDAEAQPGDDDPHADRDAVRFALVILAAAQVGGIAVYVADGLLLAAALPAAAILGVVGVALAHRPGPADRRTPGSVPPDREPSPTDTGHPAGARAGEPGGPPPAVRAAEAHLRRQQAAWKLAWWERELPPAQVGDWLDAGGRAPATLVVVDPAGEVAPDVFTAMAAALPASVRVFLVRGRGA